MTHVVELRDVIEADLPVFFEQQREPEANAMAAFPPRDQETFMTHWAKVLADPGVTKRTILLDGEVAGNIGCFAQGGRTLVGYWIGRRFWGQGVATQALAQFLELVEIRPLYARVAKHNAGSIRVLEKCGFTVYGEDRARAPTGGEEVEELIYRLDDLQATRPRSGRRG